MHLGFGLYRHMLHRDEFRFARQCGATHVVVHLVDYFGSKDRSSGQPVGDGEGWGATSGDRGIWSLDSLLRIKKALEDEGLVWAAIENFDPAHWYDILLDGPNKWSQIEELKQIIRNVGRAGIPVFGYNFSLAGVAGRVRGPYARGGAESVGMEGEVAQTPLKPGYVWNMQYDQHAKQAGRSNIPHEELWHRVKWFLEQILPVAEESGVMMAAHPDDPPVPVLHQTPRLVYQPHLYRKLLDLVPSPVNGLEYCLGSLAEMTEGDVYAWTDIFAAEKKIGYIHFRNVRGKAPNYREVFIDEGDLDMLRILKILQDKDYRGVLIPDHTPQMTCDAPWHAGMAYAMGYMRAALDSIR